MKEALNSRYMRILAVENPTLFGCIRMMLRGDYMPEDRRQLYRAIYITWVVNATANKRYLHRVNQTYGDNLIRGI